MFFYIGWTVWAYNIVQVDKKIYINDLCIHYCLKWLTIHCTDKFCYIIHSTLYSKRFNCFPTVTETWFEWRHSFFLSTTLWMSHLESSCSTVNSISDGKHTIRIIWTVHPDGTVSKCVELYQGMRPVARICGCVRFINTCVPLLVRT